MVSVDPAWNILTCASQNMNEEMSKLVAVKIVQTMTQLMKRQYDRAQRGPYKTISGQYSPVRPSRSVSKRLLLTVDRFSDLMSRTIVYNKRLFCKTFACTSSF